MGRTEGRQFSSPSSGLGGEVENDGSATIVVTGFARGAERFRVDLIGALGPHVQVEVEEGAGDSECVIRVGQRDFHGNRPLLHVATEPPSRAGLAAFREFWRVWNLANPQDCPTILSGLQESVVFWAEVDRPSPVERRLWSEFDNATMHYTVHGADRGAVLVVVAAGTAVPESVLRDEVVKIRRVSVDELVGLAGSAQRADEFIRLAYGDGAGLF